jgi:serine/threonine protein kinase
MEYQHTLPAGTELIGTYRIVRLLGSGGFANTYLAEDRTLHREVAIKEYFPNDFAVRSGRTGVQVKTAAHAKNFQWGLDRFEREARTLAKFRHPNIVRIFQIFDANDTAYIVLEFVEGADLEAWLRGLGRRPTQEELDRLTGPLLEALALVHAESILHRDVKPQNIYIRKSTGAPVLLDFGAARYATGDLTGTTAAIVSRGYSPHEAYARESKLQGPWSDIYGLAATLYRALHGEAPPESAERVLQDTLVPVARLPLKGYRKDFLKAIDWGLALRPQERPQTVAEWRARLVSGAQATGTTVPVPSEPAPGATSGSASLPLPTGPKGRSASTPPSSPGSADSARPTGGAGPTEKAASQAKVASEPPNRRLAPGPSRLPLLAALGGLLMLGGGATLAAAYLMDWRSEDPVSAIQRRNAEEQQRREAALREAEERQRKDAALREFEERQRKDAARRDAEERQRKEAALREFEEQQRKDAARRDAEERQRKEAVLREFEEQQRKDAARRDAEEQQRKDAARRDAEERQRKEAALREFEEQQRKDAARRDAEERQRKEAVLREFEEQQRKDAARREAEERQRKEAALREFEEQQRKDAARREAEERQRRKDTARREAPRQPAVKSKTPTESSGPGRGPPPMQGIGF